MRWEIITGEYPPQFGGVAHYTQLLARELVVAGDEVTVRAPGAAPVVENDEGVRVCRLSDHFGHIGLGELSRGIDRNARILVQYVPHAFGARAMNLPFCWWLFNQRRNDVAVMFHEVAYPLSRNQRGRLNLLGAAHRVMALLVARAAKRIFVAAEGWRGMLRFYAGASRSIEWIPVPSNIPVAGDREAIVSARARYVGDGDTLIGHFGTYGARASQLLRNSIQPVMELSNGARLLMIGRGSERFATALLEAGLRGANRISSTGCLEPRDASICISACDVMIQPYVDGVTARNASAIAALAHGKPLVTTRGKFTEKMWRNAGGVVTTPEANLRDLGVTALDLAHDRERADAMGRASAALYRDIFDLRHTLRALRES